MLEVGTRSWAQALRDMANRQPMLRDISAGFCATIGLGFVDEHEELTRRTVLRIEGGVVVDADEVDLPEFELADVRLTAACPAWGAILGGAIEPLRAIMLRQVTMEGDKLVLLRGMPSAKALIEAARALDADFAGAE